MPDSTEIANDIVLAEKMLQIALQFYLRAKTNAGLTDDEAYAHYDEASAQIKDQIAAERARLNT